MDQPIEGTTPGNRRLVWLIVRIAVKVLLLSWAGFWTFFVVASAASGGWGAVPYAARILIPLLALTVAAWFWPRLGGILLALAGVAAILYFHPRNVFTAKALFTFCIFPLPAIILGLTSAFVPQPTTTPSTAACRGPS